MEKVKQILVVLKRQHFWILCALAALVGLIIWNSSVGKLDAEFKRDAANIDQTLNGLRQIKTPHPNDTWTEGFGKLTDGLRQQVAAAWQELYKQQKQEVFVWPQSLGKEFQDATAALEGNPEAKLSDKLRERYQNRVRHEAARLAEIVDAPPPSEEGATGGSRNVAEGEQPKHRVRWAQLSEIQSSFDCEQAPSTQLIQYMQEELWVYEALCKVIATVNEGSKGAHDAPIIEIDEMAIAYPAADEFSATKRIMRRKTGAADTSAPAGDSNKKPDLKARGKEDEKTGTEEGGDPDAVWKNYRYVKDTGEPLMGGDLAAASPEYNLMPFRLQLVMNPRDLDHLLVACRNSVLPIEVREVRINPGGGVAAVLTGTGKLESSTAGGESHRRMEKIEVSGVVYLVKPFNPQALGITPAAEGSGGEAAEGAPAGEAPAGGAPAGGAAAPKGEAPAGGGEAPASEAAGGKNTPPAGG